MRDDFTLKIKEILAKRVGFKCSNPNCRKLTSGPAEDQNKAVNIGVAAHIAAASGGGKRYDLNQTSAERSDISNAIWLCQNCSKLIDSDEPRYTVALLKKWKELSEAAALLEIEGNTPNDLEKATKNIVISINQSGGQTAHTIVNERPSKREISAGNQKRIIDELKKLPPSSFKIWLANGDPEADYISNQIKEVLIQAGWKEKGFVYKLAGSYKEGVEIAISNDLTPEKQLLANLLSTAGLDIRANKYNDIVETTIIVGPNPKNYL